ncbi:ATP-binding protein [Actinoallomurus sp. NBC_01490]|uniref:ATP-binding protein n=1 Tax=Actinoallomurus sp. NBC_01490 TaxID=2903557 RepID=UPI002E343144|nr:ATP-binding protein [Actinoallomurus sp. NBC_01490]
MTGRTYRFPLPPHPIAAEQARIVTRLALAEWDMADLADNALLVTAELVTNATKIGDVFHLTLSCQGDTVLIEVSDSSEASPDPQRQSLNRVDGRGLLLVEACSKDWGWRLEDQGGKTVWAVCADPGTEPHTPTATPPAARM